MSIVFPAYKGTGTMDDIKKYIEKSVKPWVAKKQAAIEEVDKDYQKLTELQPVPPPRWVIAAASRAGLLWGNFVDDFRRAPYPKDWDKKGFVPGTGDTLSWNELKATYLQGIDEKSAPIKEQKAKPALKRCLDDSVKYQYFDEFSRDCEKWLAKNYKTEYHVVDELRGAPTLSNGGLDDRPPPLLQTVASDGATTYQLWHPVESGPATEKVEVVDSGSTSSGDVKKPAPPKPTGKRRR